jgi:hypothetical protein
MDTAATTGTLADSTAWKNLGTHADTMRTQTLKQMFASDPTRGTHMNAEGFFWTSAKTVPPLRPCRC